MISTFDGALAPGSAPFLLTPPVLQGIAADWDARLRSGRGGDLPRAGSAVRLLATESYDVWVARWAPGWSTPMHDHAESVTVLRLVFGTLTEAVTDAHHVDPVRRRCVRTHQGTVLTPGHVHRLTNESAEPALTVQVHTPPRHPMTACEDRSMRTAEVSPRP